MKRILVIITLMVMLISVSIIPAASAAGSDKWSFATVQVSVEENYLCAKYDIDVYLDGEKIDTVRHGDLLTFDVLLTQDMHKLTFVPDSLLANAKTWSFSVTRNNYTIECELQTHVLYVEFNRNELRNGNSEVSLKPYNRLIDRANSGASFIRIITGS